jgi:hypothetical protein
MGLTRALPPVERTADISAEELAEAMALVYLAYYNTADFEPRVDTSHKRAFGLDTLRRFARSGSTPGFVVAKATLAHRNTMTIAIEGTTSLGQIDPILQQFNTVPQNTPARCYAPFVTYRDDIWAQMLADNIIAAAIAEGTYITTFTGHSLGAAIADLLAFKWKQTYPAKPVRLIKFGAPRVGTPGYVNRTNDIVGQRMNVYTALDPIHLFPSALTFTFGLFNLAGTAARINAVSEQNCWQFNPNMNSFRIANLDSPMSSGHFLTVGQLAATLNSANPWYWHFMKSYRLAMMNWCGHARDRAFYRFNFLETPDENSWQVRWGPQTAQWDTMDSSPRLISPQPADTEPETRPVGDVSTGVGIGGGDWGDPADVVAERPRTNIQLAAPLQPAPVTAAEPRRRFIRVR